MLQVGKKVTRHRTGRGVFQSGKHDQAGQRCPGLRRRCSRISKGCLQDGLRPGCSGQRKDFSRQRESAPSHRMVAPRWREPVQRPPVEKQHDDFQSLKGQLTGGKRGGRVWGNEAGEAGARSLQGSVGHCKDLDFVLPVQRYPWRVFIWGRGQQQLPGEQIYYYRHLAEEVGDAWTCMVDETMERSDWIPEWFRSCLCSNPTF